MRQGGSRAEAAGGPRARLIYTRAGRRGSIRPRDGRLFDHRTFALPLDRTARGCELKAEFQLSMDIHERLDTGE